MAARVKERSVPPHPGDQTNLPEARKTKIQTPK
jgi:hypothetical protein